MNKADKVVGFQHHNKFISINGNNMPQYPNKSAQKYTNWFG